MLRTTFHLNSLGECGTLASEDEIAIANINMKKQTENEQRKARKALTDLTNGGGVAEASSAPAKPKRQKKKK